MRQWREMEAVISTSKCPSPDFEYRHLRPHHQSNLINAAGLANRRHLEIKKKSSVMRAILASSPAETKRQQHPADQCGKVEATSLKSKSRSRPMSPRYR